MTFREELAQTWQRYRLIVWPMLVLKAAGYAFMAGLVVGALLTKTF